MLEDLSINDASMVAMRLPFWRAHSGIEQRKDMKKTTFLGI